MQKMHPLEQVWFQNRRAKFRKQERANENEITSSSPSGSLCGGASGGAGGISMANTTGCYGSDTAPTITSSPTHLPRGGITHGAQDTVTLAQQHVEANNTNQFRDLNQSGRTSRQRQSPAHQRSRCNGTATKTKKVGSGLGSRKRNFLTQ